MSANYRQTLNIPFIVMSTSRKRVIIIFISCHIFVIGNTNLEKLSANTLRRLGLCEDHFLITSFTSATKTRFLRRAVPIAHDNVDSANDQNVDVQEMQKNITAVHLPKDGNLTIEKQMSAHDDAGSANDQNVDIQEMQKDITAAHLPKDENLTIEKQMSADDDADHFLITLFTSATKTRLLRGAVPFAHDNAGSANVDIQEMQKDITAPLPDDGNLTMEKQMSEKCALRTYKPAILKFDEFVQEEEMEWVHLEPPIHQDIECNSTKNVEFKDDSIQRNNKEKSNPKIKELKIENLYLRKKIKRLKSRMERMAQMCKCKGATKKKEIKEVLKNLINEQELHPMAKAMIHLQLHTLGTPYTEEEKILSRLLYHCSASAFCLLKEAGCNFPGQRTMKRWKGECNIQPGFCDTFPKLKETNGPSGDNGNGPDTLDGNDDSNSPDGLDNDGHRGYDSCSGNDGDDRLTQLAQSVGTKPIVLTSKQLQSIVQVAFATQRKLKEKSQIERYRKRKNS